MHTIASWSLGPKITDLDGVWMDSGDSTSLILEVKDKVKLINGRDEISKITEGKKAQIVFENFLKKETHSKINSLAAFDEHYALSTKAVFAIYPVKGEGEADFFLLQKDGSISICYYNHFRVNSNLNSIKFPNFKKYQYPKAFVGKWKINTESNDDLRTMDISEYGIGTWRNISKSKKDNIRTIVPYVYKEYSKMNSDYPEKKITQKKVNSRIESIKEVIEEEGYNVKDEDIYIVVETFLDADDGDYLVVVEDGQKVFMLDYYFQKEGVLEKIK